MLALNTREELYYTQHKQGRVAGYTLRSIHAIFEALQNFNLKEIIGKTSKFFDPSQRRTRDISVT